MLKRRPDPTSRQFAFLVNSAHDFIGVCDLELRPTFVNRAGLRLVGLTSLDELPTGRVADFFFPEDLGTLTRDFFPLVMRDGHAVTEVRFRHMRTGESIWMEYDVLRMEDADGNPSGFATISRSLAERRRTEELLREVAREKDRSLAAFRELADSMPQIVWSAGPDGTTDYTNRRWYELVGDRVVEACRKPRAAAGRAGRLGDRHVPVGHRDQRAGLGRESGSAVRPRARRDVRSLDEFIRLVHADDRDRLVAACERCASTGADFDQEWATTYE